MATRKLFAVLLLLAAAAAVISCAKSDRGAARTLRVGIEDQPKTLDPRFATDAYGVRITHHLLFSTLVEEDFDLRIVPGLAERWETPDDLDYVFHLRPGVTFHDGRPLTSEDVAFTFEHIMAPETFSPFGAALREAIASVETVDPLTIRFKLHRPFAPFLNMLVLPILPKHILERQKDFAGKPIGSGPFKFVSQSPAEIVLASNERYYGGAPKFDRLVLKVIADDNTRFLKMRKGELDLLINAIPLDKIDAVKQAPLSAMYRVIEEPGTSYNYLALNLDDPVLRDVRFRRAVALAIDADAIIVHLLQGHAIRASGLLSPANRFYEGGARVYPHDPEKARALLAEIGEAPGAGENGGKPGATLQLKTNNNAQAIGVARVLQAQLASVGIRLDVRSYEWGTFYGDVKAGNFQAASMRWVGIVEPDFFYDVFHSSRIPPNGNNRGRFRSAEMDKLLEEGRTAMGFAERKAIYSEVQKKAAEELPYISLWHVNNISIVHRRVSGYRQHPTGGFLPLRDVAID